MTDMDRRAFEVAVKRLSGALQWRGRPAEFAQMRDEYFEALQPYALDDVVAAAQVCRDTMKRFPKIVEWKAHLRRSDPSGKPADARWMSADEASEYVRASHQGFEEPPCGCLDCQAAGISERPLRYVPIAWTDGREERAWCGLIEKLVVAGHWAHGLELARWYEARDAFFGRTFRAFPGVARLLQASSSTTWIGENYAPAAAEAAHTGRGDKRSALRLVSDREPGQEG